MSPLLRPSLGAGLAALLALTGCAIVQPASSSAEVPSVVVSSTSPDPASPTPTFTPSPTPTAVSVVLGGEGIGELSFGTAEAEAVEHLTAALGEPAETTEGRLCELDSGSPWSRALHWDGVTVVFAGTKKAKSAPRSLLAWTARIEDGLQPPLALQDDLPLDLSMKELDAAYPEGDLEETGLGDGSQIFTAPNGIRFIGIGTPDTIQGGELLVCE
ncbi:MAG TPA: hypothetical protein PLE12_00200 [Propionicimonas sp.]|jgi:hypothetical protein|nr:hypothetical protein [Propionicimonas sp.]